jgi:hypothetical protein
MSGQILIDTRRTNSPDAAASETFRLIGISSYEKRYSENYWSGEYLIAHTLGIEVKFYLADEAEFPDFQYTINIAPLERIAADERDPSDDLLHIAAKKLASQGMHVARPLGVLIGSPVVYYDGDEVWIKDA